MIHGTNRHILLTLILCLVAIPICHGASPDEAPVEYSFSRDPAQVVLYVGTTGKLTNKTRSMTVYGDGRVELAYSNRSELVEEHEIQLERAALEHLVELAATHRLPEWNEASLVARMNKRLGTHFFVTQDGSRDRFVVSLKSYRRDNVTREGDLMFEFDNVGSAASLFPEIPELVGARLLVSELNSLWKDAAEKE